jgi:hypothetical protein
MRLGAPSPCSGNKVKILRAPRAARAVLSPSDTARRFRSPTGVKRLHGTHAVSLLRRQLLRCERATTGEKVKR